MKTAIIFYSKRGTTAKIAGLIANELKNNEDVALISLKSDKNPDIQEYDKVILGTPIYAGNPAKRMVNFYSMNENILMQKELGLFVCGMIPEKEKEIEELNNAYPKALLDHAKATGYLGGEFLWEKMNFFERLVIKKISKSNQSVSKIDFKAVETFAREMQ
ncbi:MAG: flavodoxin domain-containing protein [Bacteroidales bacterium]|jgi:menaquinone-dependent protoporphyrinogen oxidase|nr:flavodoxin domain-containing protein [Bacteroidales bacterium]